MLLATVLHYTRMLFTRSWNCITIIVSRVWAEWRVQSLTNARISVFAVCPYELWIPPTLVLTGLRGSFPEAKATRVWSLPGTPFGAEVKNVWSCTYAFPNVFMAWFLIRTVKRMQRCLAITFEVDVMAFTWREIGKVWTTVKSRRSTSDAGRLVQR
jgi:hypothetical protein